MRRDRQRGEREKRDRQKEEGRQFLCFSTGTWAVMTWWTDARLRVRRELCQTSNGHGRLFLPPWSHRPQDKLCITQAGSRRWAAAIKVNHLDWQIGLSVGPSAGASEDFSQVQNPRLPNLRPLCNLRLRSGIRSCSANYCITVHLVSPAKSRRRLSQTTPPLIHPYAVLSSRTLCQLDRLLETSGKGLFHELSQLNMIGLRMLTINRW